MPPKPTGTYGRPAPHDALRRQANFGRKVVPAHVGNLVAALKPGMRRNLAGKLSSLSKLSSAVEARLATESGMTAFLVPQYQNFARQMWASLQAHPGDVGYGPRASEIAAIMADWASRGLNPGILWQIMQHVWGYFFQA